MFVLLIIWFLMIAVTGAMPTFMLKKCQGIFWWDYTYPFTGVAAWFLLSMTKAGSMASLSNFVVEEFWIAVVSITVPWVRWVLARFQKEQHKTLSFILTLLPIIVAIVIRLSMPTLPE